MTLYCPCLNIKIDAADTTLQVIDEKLLLPLIVNSEFADGKFGRMVSERITLKFPSLVHKRDCGPYTLFTCANCELTACAVNRKADTVVLSSRLLDERGALDACRHEDYSPPFGVRVLHTSCPISRWRTAQAPILPLSELSGNALSDLQHQLNTFILSEEIKMEKDIRRYEAAAREKYAALCAKVEGQQKQLSRIAMAAQQEAPLTVTEDDDDSAYERSTEEALAADLPSHAKASHEVVSISTAAHKRAGEDAVQVRRSSSNPDALFDLDEDDAEGADPFAVSDEEVKDSRDDDQDGSSSNTAVSGLLIVGSSQRQQTTRSQHTSGSRLGTSVPMPIPSAMQRRRKSYVDDEDGDSNSISSEGESHMPDLKDMGASIKALAQSVGYDGTEMFGDLPRPRLNTYDRLLM